MRRNTLLLLFTLFPVMIVSMTLFAGCGATTTSSVDCTNQKQVKSHKVTEKGDSITAILYGTYNTKTGAFCKSYAAEMHLDIKSGRTGTFYYRLYAGDIGCGLSVLESSQLKIQKNGSYDSSITPYHDGTNGQATALEYTRSGQSTFKADTGCIQG